MAEPGERSSHRRSVSTAALNLLRRRDATRDDDCVNEDTTSQNSSRYPVAPMSNHNRTQSSMGPPQSSSAALSRTPSGAAASIGAAASATGSGSLKPAQSHDKGPSLEQSVKKFRVVEALRSGDTASISKIIRESVPTDIGGRRMSASSMAGPGLEDTTILHLAIQCAEFPVVEYVLSDGQNTLDINARDKDGDTPLHVAAAQGRTPVVKLLLEQSGINDAVVNAHGKLPIDLARNPEIFQLLQLSRSLYTESKVKQVQDIIARADYDTLAHVLEEPRFKTVVDINSPEFASDPTTVSTGGTLLHEAARRRNIKLIQTLLLHGADPFQRDRKGKLPQSVTNDDGVKSILKKSPAAVAAQRGIQEKAVLGQAASQGAFASAAGDPLAGRESREMKGYLKKWTNYRKGYQLRWFVLEDGVLSYYKHQDDAGSACRGAINMRIAKLHMTPDEKTKFEILGKSSVKYTLKANHEVEAKRWYWSLNNSIRWTKDQAEEEDRQAARNAELLKQAKAEHGGGGSPGGAASLSVQDTHSDNGSSPLPSRHHSAVKLSAQPRAEQAGVSTAGSADDDYYYADAGTDAGTSRFHGHLGNHNGDGPVIPGDPDDDDDYGDDVSVREEPSATRDALNITAQSAKIQLETMSQVHAALMGMTTRTPATPISDTKVSQALGTYDGAMRSLSGLIGDLLRISKDRDAYWQYRLERETSMRRMWEESMAQVAQEQEELQARYGEAEEKRKLAKKALREILESRGEAIPSEKKLDEMVDQGEADKKSQHSQSQGNDAKSFVSTRSKPTALQQMADISEDDSEGDDDEFFDAVDNGEVKISQMPPSQDVGGQGVVISGGVDISSSFKGYENGVRTRLKMDADNRPKVSLWGILKSMIGKDMTKMTLPVSFNEPTSLLYRCGEDMEYADLLDQAADRPDSIERLVYVAAFAASEYASTVGRIAKPFNPLLGETFEYVRPDKNYRFFIEQVSHHPPVGAAWAESPQWTYWGESNVKSKFYGKSFDINPLGTWFLKLRPKSGGKEELYTWKKVTSSVIGIITGNPTVDNYGPMEVKNWNTGEVALLDFKPRGWKASSAYQLSGKVTDASGRVRVSMGGRWNSKIYARVTNGYEAAVDESAASSSATQIQHRGGLADPNEVYLVWQANERPAGIPFNLTPFVLTFNHIDDKLRPWLAPTDSRLRPDQRAMEEGEYDFAATEKNRLEEAQRARRRDRELKGEEFRPAWFTRARCEVSGQDYWKFNGKYWEQRDKAGPDGDGHAWDGLEAIFDERGAENAPPPTP
ncbi:oxysterol-binding protein 1 [Geosmithia morbida]|uniref:Oxysterol-binding protein 1 n=1 Tax=Geosmithia morbida TaxID=1094350 RepID=A0A9P4YX61_9HYPO|nr:oxysterol-binding protein 1 [Geosmithia morbida]KAF4124485.1 oxysterol-binding protein 1 [Geosmithia morbida]